MTNTEMLVVLESPETRFRAFESNVGTVLDATSAGTIYQFQRSNADRRWRHTYTSTYGNCSGAGTLGRITDPGINNLLEASVA